ncbi:MAG TPA: hypothetical protein QF604_01845 [Candidatus Latescibacteria bacterium]|nr:hypothetical protein [Gemmatimonadota bacterium]MDP7365461.1 hypothetical protein [Candidatus Latescibacterota bacterium]MDP7633897.1 hypothetical protein [Candidatus Latescibacterota bacterium]HCV26255.1 hypothetical protein [Candidatus Latescibacterota bacterium]HJN26641.1 hypothetical protein [Candidatus Latescibacterota bacterium]
MLRVRSLLYRSAGVWMLLLASICGPAVAQSGPLTMRGEQDTRIQQGIDLIYQLQLDEAALYFEQIIDADPDNPLGHFFRAMVGWWRVLIDLEDTRHDEEFYRLLQACIDVCDRRLEVDPDDFDAILFKGGAIGFRGRLRGDRGQFVRAARDGLRCLPLLDKSRSLEPTNKDILFGQGIYNYFAEVIPKRYPIVRPVMLFLHKGDRQLGLTQLRDVAEGGRYARAEARYFLAQIHKVFEVDHLRALPYLEDLHHQYPDNALFHRYRARTLVTIGRWGEGVAQYEQVVERSRRAAPGYHTRGLIEALFYIGKDAYRRRDDAMVIDSMTQVEVLSVSLGEDLETQAARGYTSLANLYWGMVLDMAGHRSEAMERYDRVLRLPAQGKSHTLARRYRLDPFERGRSGRAGPQLPSPSSGPTRSPGS